MTSIESFLRSLSEDMSKEDIHVCNTAGSHPFRCNCPTCLHWWALAGPDGDKPGCYGPFTKDEVNAKQRELNIEETP